MEHAVEGFSTNLEDVGLSCVLAELVLQEFECYRAALGDDVLASKVRPLADEIAFDTRLHRLGIARPHGREGVQEREKVAFPDAPASERLIELRGAERQSAGV